MVKINLSLLHSHLRRHLKCIKTDPTTSINIGMIDLRDKANFRRMKWIPIGNELQLVIIIKFNPLRWGIISHKVHSLDLPDEITLNIEKSGKVMFHKKVLLYF